MFLWKVERFKRLGKAKLDVDTNVKDCWGNHKTQEGFYTHIASQVPLNSYSAFKKQIKTGNHR